MFEKSVEDRLTAWAALRAELETSDDPLAATWEFWRHAPYIHYNNKIDPFNRRSWPTPWEIIIENKYDDFTKVLMIAWTLKLTAKFKDSKIEIKTYTDAHRSRQYNLVFIDDEFVINYTDNGINTPSDIPESFQLENLIEVQRPR